MRLKYIELNGFKSFSKKTVLEFEYPIIAIVGPNGSGKSNIVEAFRFVLGEQSMKSMRGKQGKDLIFKGSKSLSAQNHAVVSVYFDNIDKIFKLVNENGENIDFNYDIISISREVYSDGLNKYILNKNEVRLKDINNLLASVNIGSSGHHIISQGEADRILNASPKDRKEMIEDALGLKIYQYRIKDSERKLEKTNNNMKEIGLLRRENAPHLSFLKKQIEKIEKTKEFKIELFSFYKEYLKKESIYLENEELNLSNQKNKLTKEIEDINEIIILNFEDISKEENKKLEKLKEEEIKLSNLHRIKNEIERKLGRIEGMLEIEEVRNQKKEIMPVSFEEMEYAINEINSIIQEALNKDNIEEIKNILNNIKNILNKFDKNKREEKIPSEDSTTILNLKNTHFEIMNELQKIKEEENNIENIIKSQKEEIRKEIEEGREKEKEKFTLKVRHQELISFLQLNSLKEENLEKAKESFVNEIKEGSVLIDQDILAYKDFQIEDKWNKDSQEELKRKIERIKIKLEDIGIGNSNEIMKEYKEMTERNKFLIKEMEDLAKSIESLNQLILELKEKIDKEFKEGIKKINIEFQEFFSLMFGGGTGELSVIVENKRQRKEKIESMDYSNFAIEDMEEEILFEQGIEINVSLPKKKVKELHSLSGGERSLTSIALLFAMSQVNPPPFLILDETDAALDEANSRKYGDMIERLSKHSQLILVTHNRETMSRAEALYGITIGFDGASKLLSVRFDEAVAIAK